VKDLARHWIPVNQRVQHDDTNLFDQYVLDFNLAKSSASKRPVSIVNPPTIPLNAAQESQFKKLKSGCPTLSKCEYVEAAITSKSNDVYDRFVRRSTRGLIFGASFNKSACNRRAYLERRKSVMEQRETDTLAIFKRLSKHVMDGTSWKLLIQEGDTVPMDELQHDDMTFVDGQRGFGLRLTAETTTNLRWKSLPD